MSKEEMSVEDKIRNYGLANLEISKYSLGISFMEPFGKSIDFNGYAYMADAVLFEINSKEIAEREVWLSSDDLILLGEQIILLAKRIKKRNKNERKT